MTSSGNRGGGSSRTRRACGWLAAAVASFAIYASLLPFEFRAVPPDRALARFGRVMFTDYPERTSRTNYLANALLFVPMGFGLAGAFLAERSGTRLLLAAVPATLAIGLGVSCTAEFLQVFTPRRFVSRADVAAQTLGNAAGLLLWIGAGPFLTGWVRTTVDRQRGDAIARVLSAYAVVWTLVSLAPFDLTVDLGAIATRYRTGRISLDLLPASQTFVGTLWSVCAVVLSAAPLGALGLVGWTGPRARRHSRAALLLGAAFVVAVEGAQILVRSRAARLGDALWGLLGVAIGVWAGRWALQHRQAVAALPPRAISSRALVALAAWVGVLCLYHWQPFDFTADTAMIRDKLNGMSLVPFAGYWSGSDLNTVRHVIVKAALALPFGALAAFVAHAPAVSGRAAMPLWTLAAAVTFAAIEAGQLLLPSRTPDPTDVLVSAGAAVAGLWIGRRLRS